MNFWDFHGIAFLIFIATFPRITMLVATTMSYGLLCWVGWVIAPRLTVAIFATMTYADSNLPLVIISWMIAVGGEYSEKCTCVRKRR